MAFRTTEEDTDQRGRQSKHFIFPPRLCLQVLCRPFAGADGPYESLESPMHLLTDAHSTHTQRQAEWSVLQYRGHLVSPAAHQEPVRALSAASGQNLFNGHHAKRFVQGLPFPRLLLSRNSSSRPIRSVSVLFSAFLRHIYVDGKGAPLWGCCGLRSRRLSPNPPLTLISTCFHSAASCGQTSTRDGVEVPWTAARKESESPKDATFCSPERHVWPPPNLRGHSLTPRLCNAPTPDAPVAPWPSSDARLTPGTIL